MIHFAVKEHLFKRFRPTPNSHLTYTIDVIRTYVIVSLLDNDNMRYRIPLHRPNQRQAPSEPSSIPNPQTLPIHPAAQVNFQMPLPTHPERRTLTYL